LSEAARSARAPDSAPATHPRSGGPIDWRRDARSFGRLTPESDLRVHYKVPRELKAICAAIAAVLVGVVVYSFVARVDKVVVTTGVLESSQPPLAVRSLYPGRIDRRLVDVGDVVRNGDLLIVVDPEQIDLHIERLLARQHALARHIWRDYHEIEPYLGLDERTLMRAEMSAIAQPSMTDSFRQQLSRRLANTLSILDASLVRLEADAAATGEQLESAAAIADLEELAYERVDHLYGSNAAHRSLLDESGRRVHEASARVAALRGSLLVLGSEQRKLQSEKDRAVNEFVVERLARIHDNVDEHRMAEADLAIQRAVRRDHDVRAPMDAIVDRVEAQGRGEVIAEGALLLELRPLFAMQDIQIEAELGSDAAVWVQPGMAFRASPAGRNTDSLNYLEGAVDYLSMSSRIRDGQRVFYLRGSVSAIHGEWRDDASANVLRPGLEVVLRIHTGDRRLIDYIVDPVLRHVRAAMREPS
jgi:HlyD family secretion protein